MYELQLTRKKEKEKKKQFPAVWNLSMQKELLISISLVNLSMESLPKTISPLNILLVTVACGVRTFFFPLIY